MTKTGNNRLAITDIGEFGFLGKILPRLRAFDRGRFHVAVGDDAAVTRRPSRAVLSIDGLTDGTHFRLRWLTGFDRRHGFSFGRALGWKLMGSALSDLAAMGDVTDRWAMVFAGVPAQTKVTFLNDVFNGIIETARRYRCAIAGGDTVASRRLTLVAAVGGRWRSGRLLTRGGARPGDALCVAGTVSDASAGLRLLERKLDLPPKPARYFVKRFFRPEPLFEASRILSEINGVTSVIDLSDPLPRSIELLLKGSGLSADIDLGNLPHSAAYRRWRGNKRGWPDTGEDYALLFTCRPSALASLSRRLTFRTIGSVSPRKGVLRAVERGRPIPVPSSFEHFS